MSLYRSGWRRLLLLAALGVFGFAPAARISTVMLIHERTRTPLEPEAGEGPRVVYKVPALTPGLSIVDWRVISTVMEVFYGREWFRPRLVARMEMSSVLSDDQLLVFPLRADQRGEVRAVHLNNRGARFEGAAAVHLGG